MVVGSSRDFFKASSSSKRHFSTILCMFFLACHTMRLTMMVATTQYKM